MSDFKITGGCYCGANQLRDHRGGGGLTPLSLLDLPAPTRAHRS